MAKQQVSISFEEALTTIKKRLNAARKARRGGSSYTTVAGNEVNGAAVAEIYEEIWDTLKAIDLSISTV